MGNQATILGLCKVNGEKGYLFRVVVRGVDEPGKYDWFEIELLDHPAYPDGYWRGAELGFPDDAGGGGNIQIHIPAP